MKKIKTLAIVLVLLISLPSLAGEKTCEDRIRNKDIFTQEQIQIRIAHCENLKPKRKAFRATLSDEQKAIKKDKTLSRKEKKAKLAPTLTAEQKAMKDEIKTIVKAQRKEFRASLTDEQKKQLKERRQTRK